jgi:hypothetical protein
VYGDSSGCPGGTANGAPWLSDGWKPVAIHEGTRISHDFARCGFNACIRNFGRRIDGSVDTFIKAWSFDF